jgi:hypothetical protein
MKLLVLCAVGQVCLALLNRVPVNVDVITYSQKDRRSAGERALTRCRLPQRYSDSHRDAEYTIPARGRPNSVPERGSFRSLGTVPAHWRKCGWNSLEGTNHG